MRHGPKSRSRRALGRIGRGVADWSWAIRAKHHIENSKNSEEITINLKKNVDTNIYVPHVQDSQNLVKLFFF